MRPAYILTLAAFTGAAIAPAAARAETCSVDVDCLDNGLACGTDVCSKAGMCVPAGTDPGTCKTPGDCKCNGLYSLLCDPINQTCTITAADGGLNREPGGDGGAADLDAYAPTGPAGGGGVDASASQGSSGSTSSSGTPSTGTATSSGAVGGGSGSIATGSSGATATGSAPTVGGASAGASTTGPGGATGTTSPAGANGTTSSGTSQEGATAKSSSGCTITEGRLDRSVPVWVRVFVGLFALAWRQKRRNRPS